MNAGRMRLLHLRDQNDAAGSRMEKERGRFAALADPAAAPRVVSAFNLFQTPAGLADRVAGILLDRVGFAGRILEPSAGLGRLYRALRDCGHTGPVTLAEQSGDCCRELYDMTRGGDVTLKQGDFLGMSLGLFDGVLMNPPFKMWRDIKHIRHAFSMLKPGGWLVSLCANGPKQRAQLMPDAVEWIDLEAGAFKESGTNVRAAIVVMQK